MSDRDLSKCQPQPATFNPAVGKLMAWRHNHKQKAFEIKSTCIWPWTPMIATKH